ncbi:haloacid dehalogenase-like hydrolase [Acinetobacter sp. MD2(2019)]|uniref:haloacid dehalogenase-like hydrolase n=1 Tax=Acinetobacter sp. MD2(2019) TaxID=2605273 RepID=UPI002D1E7014|nr:haloacid dehalogenase-like hydrolase [Acinetobacter sp. MD2(2019)]MEB3754197.1 haloacid dehalogenase-like hydrolase [Acinetobacter sp. MD2(2019)]
MQLQNSKKILTSAVVAGILAITGCHSIQTTVPVVTTAPSPQQVVLEAGHWDAFNRQQLEQLIQQYGKNSPTYNPAKPPYIVTDFDNTSVFLDIEEATLIYQLEHLDFKVSPEQLNQIIRKDIGNDNFVAEYNNQQGHAVNINQIAPDIIESYRWLYAHYSGLKGKQSLEQIQQSPHYQNFITKMRYLYAAIGDTFAHEVSYPWVTYLFTGFNASEVREMVKNTVAWQKDQKIGPVTWTSPTALAGQAGVVSITWENGLRPYKEMQNLFKTFQSNGFDVYVCSASFIDVVKEIVSNPNVGYDINENNVYAMELSRSPEGKILPVFRPDYYQTQGVGKTKTIQKFLVSKYGYGPIFVAGDSEGDQNMMQDFSETQKVLMVNRLRKPSTDIGQFSKLAVEQYGQANPKYLLQGRDANTGEFVPSNKSIAYGAIEGKALR